MGVTTDSSIRMERKGVREVKPVSTVFFVLRLSLDGV
jgi:hypothetical protein